MSGDPPTLCWLQLGDPPTLWQQLGFVRDDDVVAIDGVEIRLGGPASGISGWGLSWAHESALEHLPVPEPARPSAGANPEHPNGIVGVDHLVVWVGDLDAAQRDLARMGIEVRRRRDVTFGDRPMAQLFAWVGTVVLEVVGPTGATDDLASLWGLTLVSGDLDATRQALGDAAGPIRTAVQPGRRICSLDTRPWGGSTRLAVMDVHPKRRAHPPDPTEGE